MNKEKRVVRENKKEIRKELKVYFLIFNLIFAIVAFSYLIGEVDAAEQKVSATEGIGLVSTIAQLFGMSSQKSPNSNTPIPAGSSGTSGSPAAVISQTTTPATGNAVGVTAIPAQVQNQNIPASQFWEEFVKAHPNAEGLAKTWGYGKQWDYWKAKAYSTTTPATGNPVAVPPGTVPPTGNQIPPMSEKPTVTGALGDYFTSGLIENLKYTLIGGAAGAAIGYFAGGKNGWIYGGIAGAAGTFTYQILKKMMPGSTWMPLLGGLAVAALIFLLTYAKEKKQIVEFQCLPWQAATGGDDCEKCNLYPECSEYTCKSLGQACDLVNKGEKNQSCVWKNPRDVNSPTIEMTNVTKEHHFIPDKTIRPPATGVEILLDSGKCIKAFNPIEFTFITNELSQCKVDYNLTSDSKTAYDSMGYYVGGTTEFIYTHTEKLSLPGPSAINKVNPILQNDGTYTLYIRCQDANGNSNVNPFSVRFCVDAGPDTTPPVIVNLSILSGNPIQFNRTSLSLEVYINEPADCKWSKEDRDYDNMERNMSCSNQLWEMNNEATYTCRALLTGIEDRKENLFYFRCLDKPDYEKNERNVNKQSYLYRVIGTQPLNILKIQPDSTVKGATDLILVNLTIKTDNGYNNGEAICFYSTNGKEGGYIKFSNTGGNEHNQRQDLIPGNYSYYYKCLDLGGNTVYNSTSFLVESDKNMPQVIRFDKQNGELRIVTDKEAECAYSNINCNFEIESGIVFSTVNRISHFSEWKISKNYFIRCMDKNNNQPDPNVCSIIIRPVDMFSKTSVLEL